MLFNSHEFIFLFFPLALLGYGICMRIAGDGAKGKRSRLPGLFLLVVSLLFYAWNSPKYLPILLGSIMVNYAFSRKRSLLLTGIIFNLGMLCGFKYLAPGGFFPLAISFYTFSQIAFLVECYRGNVKNKEFLSYGLYVAYFPKMMQGPIAPPEEMYEELQSLPTGHGEGSAVWTEEVGGKPQSLPTGHGESSVARTEEMYGKPQSLPTGHGEGSVARTEEMYGKPQSLPTGHGEGSVVWSDEMNVKPDGQDMQVSHRCSDAREACNARRGKWRRRNWEQIYRNLYLFVLGLFKKVLIADTFGKAVDLGYGNLAGLNSLDGIIVMLAYTLQLYFDFSGYCDMAMGISGMFGIRLPVNFRSPYKAASILEFWKGWHITLTRFFTKYLYIPLGGNRKGRCRTYVNTLLVFFLSGIWHGTGIQFIVWGMMHGGLYVLTRMFMDSRVYRRFHEWKERQKSGLRALGHGLAVFFTFLYVNAAWVFFRAPSVREAGALLRTIFRFQGGRVNWGLAGCFNLDEFWYVIKVLRLDSWQYAHYICMVLIFAAVLLLVFAGKTAAAYVETVEPKLAHSLIMAVLFVWSVLSLSGVSSFLYVNF